MKNTYTEEDIKHAYQTGFSDGFCDGSESYDYVMGDHLEEAWKVYRGAYLL